MLYLVDHLDINHHIWWLALLWRKTSEKSYPQVIHRFGRVIHRLSTGYPQAPKNGCHDSVQEL